jgi:hypothetical protein
LVRDRISDYGYLPRAIDKANHGSENLHHYRVVVLAIILEYVLKFVRLFAPSQLLFSTLLVLLGHRSAKLPAITSDRSHQAPLSEDSMKDDRIRQSHDKQEERANRRP